MAAARLPALRPAFAAARPGTLAAGLGRRPALARAALPHARCFSDDAVGEKYKSEIFDLTNFYMEAKDALEDANESWYSFPTFQLFNSPGFSGHFLLFQMTKLVGRPPTSTRTLVRTKWPFDPPMRSSATHFAGVPPSLFAGVLSIKLRFLLKVVCAHWLPIIWLGRVRKGGRRRYEVQLRYTHSQHFVVPLLF